MSHEIYKSRGKGFMQIASDAKKMLASAIQVDRMTGRATFSADDVGAIFDRVDDEEHFREPLALALLELVLDRSAVVVLENPGAAEING